MENMPNNIKVSFFHQVIILLINWRLSPLHVARIWWSENENFLFQMDQQ